MRLTWQVATRSKTTLRTTLFTTALCAALLLPMLYSPGIVHADSVVQYGTAWLNGGGVDIMSGGDGSHSCVSVSGAPGQSQCSNTAGQVYAGDKWQCVEMVNRLYLTKGWTTTTWWGSGSSIINDVPNHPGLTDELQDHISYVNAGDVVTETHSTDGHAGIINTIDSNGTIHIKSQNADLDSQASITSGSLSAGTAHYTMTGWIGYSVQAVVHHPSGTVTPGTTRNVSGQWQWNLRNSNTSGTADITYTYGTATTDTPVTGDWDGNGTFTPGVVRNDGAGNWQWLLRNSNSGGPNDVPTFTYGSAATDKPLTGDWNGDRFTTPGVVRDNGAGQWQWLLSNYNSSGPNDVPTFTYGLTTDTPITGDWDGNGTFTPGVIRNESGQWHFLLRNSNTSGPADLDVTYGTATTDTPIVGDWDGNGTFTPGVVRDNGAGQWYWLLRNSNSNGVNDVPAFTYGVPSTDAPHPGNWDGI